MKNLAKRLISGLLVGAMAVALVACGGSGSSSSGSSSSGSTGGSTGGGDAAEHWTIGFSNRSSSDVFLKAIEDAFVELVNADDTLDILTADANNDSNLQLDQLDNFNVQGINCAVLIPNDGKLLLDHISAWNDEGTPVFCISQRSEGDGFTFVGISDYDMGMQQSTWAYENLPEGAKVLYLGGNLSYKTSIDRRAAFVDGLKDRIQKDWDGKEINANGDIEVLSWQECMYTMEDGMTITEDWIQTFPEFDAIIAVNDGSALGAIEALKAAGKTDVIVCGIDAVEDALAAVKSGDMACTVMQSAQLQAQALYDAVKKAQAGESNPEEILTDVTCVSSENVDDYL